MARMAARGRGIRTRRDTTRLAGAVLALLVLLAGALPGAAADRGLLWNRTGLPLVFPLIVKSDPPFHWRVTLTDAATGTPAMAAHFEGGKFFRVLVPPGTFRLTFEGGGDWTGEDFASPPARRYTLPEEMTFRVRGIGTKEGWVVDIRGKGELAARPLPAPDGFDICQYIHRGLAPWERDLEDRRARLRLLPGEDEDEARDPFAYARPRLRVRDRVC